MREMQKPVIALVQEEGTIQWSSFFMTACYGVVALEFDRFTKAVAIAIASHTA
jgi:hypothetical protein